MLRSYAVLARVSPGYPPLQGRLSTCYSPVRRFTSQPKSTFSLDLHVLSTPPAFILSQDQTLQLKILTAIDRLPIDNDAFEINLQPHCHKAVLPEEYCRCFSSIQFSKNRRAVKRDFRIYPNVVDVSTP